MQGRAVGLAFAVSAAACWAVGGLAAQELFAHHDISPAWLVGVRLSVGGLLLLAFRPGTWRSSRP
jgi:drug/metabolite transporter (DMT)-like permease